MSKITLQLSSELVARLCQLAKMFNKQINELTVYEIMTLGLSFHKASQVKVLLRAYADRIKCEV